MRIGLLIIGSLIWDDLPLRQEWRSEHLIGALSRRVCAPIRYGRRSSKRASTYTMVFSHECCSPIGGTGVGLAVPFRKALETPEDLLEISRDLWAAEAERTSVEGVYSDGWGSVGLLPNPESPMVGELLPPWAEAVSGSPRYGQLATADEEEPILDPHTGLAQFRWPSTVGGESPLDLDCLLLTATDPSIRDGTYADPVTIAEAWKREPEHARYFHRSREHGIETVQDDQILHALGV